MSKIGFSIDLQSELAKLTQRQYLNDVHFLIQLVRHVLRFEPREITIEAKRKTLFLTHDGAPLPDEEWRLLQILLRRGEGTDNAVLQDALTRMEEHHGIALLSVFLNHPRVTLYSGQRCLNSDGGVVSVMRADRVVDGMELHLHRKEAATLKNERKEMVFFCAGMQVPLHYNKEQLNTQIALSDQMFMGSFQSPGGHGAVGIPATDDLCHLTFYKQGVRIGTRQYLPDDGLLYHGFFNGTSTDYEPNFKETVLEGEALMREQAGKLLAGLSPHFEEFSTDQRKRVKKILFGLDHEWWHVHFTQVPVFESNGSKKLSLADLKALQKQFEAIPYSAGRERTLPEGFPILQPEEIAFLNEMLGLELKPGRARGEPDAIPPQRNFDVYPTGKLDTVRRGFLEALNKGDLFTQFAFTEERCGVQVTEGKRMVYLPLAHPMVNEALDRYHQQPAAAAMLGYRLAALARDASGPR